MRMFAARNPGEHLTQDRSPKPSKVAQNAPPCCSAVGTEGATVDDDYAGEGDRCAGYRYGHTPATVKGPVYRMMVKPVKTMHHADHDGQT
jgi:hypothetical protein